MKTNGLTTEKILSRGDATRDLEGKVSAIGIDGVGCPSAADETSLVDLEPLQTSDSGGLGIGNLSHVDNLRPRVSTSIPLGGDGGASSGVADIGSRF